VEDLILRFLTYFLLKKKKACKIIHGIMLEDLKQYRMDDERWNQRNIQMLPEMSDYFVAVVFV
jgi:hypothetical protein